MGLGKFSLDPSCVVHRSPSDDWSLRIAVSRNDELKQSEGKAGDRAGAELARVMCKGSRAGQGSANECRSSYMQK